MTHLQTDKGWVIVDEAGSVWGGDQFFPSQEGANETMEALRLADHQVRAARRVTHAIRSTSTTAKIETRILVDG